MSILASIKNTLRESFIVRRIETFHRNRFLKRLENDNFTILCSNCIGGLIYHRLGKQFLSPTVNLFILQKDFVEFCCHLDFYLAQELEFAHNGEFNVNYPVAYLRGNGEDIPDVPVHFNHYASEADAAEKWNSRKARICRDNMYIILYMLDGLTIEDAKRLEQVPCKNKVLLTAKPLPEISWSHYIKPIMRHKIPYAYLEKSLFGVRYYERKFDFISFLNQ